MPNFYLIEIPEGKEKEIKNIFTELNPSKPKERNKY